MNPSPDGPRAPLLDALRLLALWVLAVVQPLFDLLGRHPTFLVAHRAGPGDIFLLAGLATFLPPLVLTIVEQAAGLAGERPRRSVHTLLVALLFVALVLPPLNRAVETPMVAVGTAVSLSIVATILYRSATWLRSLVSLLSISAVIVPAVFLLTPAVFRQLTPASTAGPRRPGGLAKGGIPVVLVIFDELPVIALMDETREIDAGRYPSFAALASDSHWYRNATTVSSETSHAVAAVLTGLYPRAGTIPTDRDYPTSLFTLLAPTHRLNVHEPLTRLCPAALCGQEEMPFGVRLRLLAADLLVVYLHVIVPRAWSGWLPDVSRQWAGFGLSGTPEGESTDRPQDAHGWRQLALEATAKDRRSQFDGFLASIERTHEPSLNFLHIVFPHTPYEYVPSGKRYAPTTLPPLRPGGLWSPDARSVAAVQQRFLLQVGAADRMLGELVEHLKRLEMYNRSLIVVTSDHGVSFRAGDHRRRLTATNAGEILPIPMLVKLPNQTRPVVVDDNVESVDILPTMLDVLGILEGRSLGGVSLLRGRPPGRRRKTVWSRGRLEEFAPELPEREEALARQLALFGWGPDPELLFGYADRWHLVGRPASFDSTPGQEGPVVEIDQIPWLAEVDLEDDLIPVRITGTVRGVTQEELALAIAVNDVAVTVTYPYAVDASWEVSAMIPERALRPGYNRVSVFAVQDGGGDAARLTPIRGGSTTDSYRLHRMPGGEGAVFVEGSSGRLEVTKGGIVGHLDGAKVLGDEVRFWGWAYDVARSRLPDRVLVFVDDELIHSLRTTVARDGVARRHGDRARYCGFRFSIPLGRITSRRSVGQRGAHTVRLIALSGSSAAELKYFRAFPWAPAPL